MYRFIALLLGLTLAATATARDTTSMPPLDEADRDALARIVVDTWAPHVDAEHLDRWLARVEERADNAPLAWLETAAAALDLRSVDLALDGMALLDGPVPAAFGSAGGNLVFTPIVPCRLLDTRVSSPRGGVIPADGERMFFGYISNFLSTQGGANGNCGLTAPTRPEALAITLVSVNPSGDGYLTAYPEGAERPLAASLNYTGGRVDSTGLILPINNEPSVHDFTIYSFQSTHVVADVMGYFSRPEAAPLDCFTLPSAELTIVAGATVNFAAPACPPSHSASYGGCRSTSPNAVLFSSSVTDGQTQCRMRNTGATDITADASTRCCRIPGR